MHTKKGNSKVTLAKNSHTSETKTRTSWFSFPLNFYPEFSYEGVLWEFTLEGFSKRSSICCSNEGLTNPCTVTISWIMQFRFKSNLIIKCLGESSRHEKLLRQNYCHLCKYQGFLLRATRRKQSLSPPHVLTERMIWISNLSNTVMPFG